MCRASSVFWSPPTPILPASVGCPRCVSSWPCLRSAAAQRYNTQPLSLFSHTHTQTEMCLRWTGCESWHKVSGSFLLPQVSATNSLELVKEQWSSYRNQCLDYINATPPATGEPISSQRELAYERGTCRRMKADLLWANITDFTDLLSTAGLVCNRTFDLYACWPDGLPGTTVNVSCPWFLPWYRKGECECESVVVLQRNISNIGWK